MEIDEFVALARRWPALEALREEPLDRRDLQERVGVSRPTIHRQVRALEGAGLVSKRNGVVALTPVGELAVTEFARVFDALGTTTALGKVVRWLPVKALGFEFARLQDAEVVLPQPNDPFAPTRRMLRQVHAADRIRMVTYTFLPEGNPATRQCFVDDDQYFEGVFDPGLVDTLRADPASATHLEEQLAQGTRIAVAPEPVPIILTIADETVIIGTVDGGGSPQGVVVTDDDVVRVWASETVDDYFERATRLTSADVGVRAVSTDGGT